MVKPTARAISVFTACWAVPYVVSKIHFAMEGKLGIHFGPTIYPSDYTAYDGPGAVSTGQWANAAVGAVFMLFCLLIATPIGARINRWVIAVPLFVFAALQLVFAAVSMYRAVVTERGGTIFAVYLVLWAIGLIVLSVSAVRRPRGAIRTDPTEMLPPQPR